MRNIKRLLLKCLARYAVGRLCVYGRLMRVEKPIGTLLLLWPTLWALWIASEGVPNVVILLAFMLGTFLMRSAGCVVNDFADRDIDGAVARTNQRPFAQGLVSKSEAMLLLLILCLLAALCLLPLNRLAEEELQRMLAKCISTEEYERAAEIKAAIDEKRRQQKQEKI